METPKNNPPNKTPTKKVDPCDPNVTTAEFLQYYYGKNSDKKEYASTYIEKELFDKMKYISIEEDRSLSYIINTAIKSFIQTKDSKWYNSYIAYEKIKKEKRLKEISSNSFKS